MRHSGGTSFAPQLATDKLGRLPRILATTSDEPQALETAQDIAKKVTDALGGRGIFGVELFVKGDEVWFSEVSPRPHDTGMVTLLSQNLSEFALHVRAILGLPVPVIETRRPGASYVILGEGESNDITFSGVDKALESPDTEVRLFGKA